MWVGGLDGGIYVEIKKIKTDPPKIYDAIIYFGVGDIDYKGKLIINSINNEFNYKNVSSYSAWDCDTLYLNDGRQLTIYKARN